MGGSGSSIVEENGRTGLKCKAVNNSSDLGNICVHVLCVTVPCHEKD